MTGTICDLFTHNQSRSYLNHLVNRCNVSVGAVRPTTDPRATIRILQNMKHKPDDQQ
jgi:hypothetical protein